MIFSRDLKSQALTLQQYEVSSSAFPVWLDPVENKTPAPKKEQRFHVPCAFHDELFFCAPHPLYEQSLKEDIRPKSKDSIGTLTHSTNAFLWIQGSFFWSTILANNFEILRETLSPSPHPGMNSDHFFFDENASRQNIKQPAYDVLFVSWLLNTRLISPLKFSFFDSGTDDTAEPSSSCTKLKTNLFQALKELALMPSSPNTLSEQFRVFIQSYLTHPKNQKSALIALIQTTGSFETAILQLKASTHLSSTAARISLNETVERFIPKLLRSDLCQHRLMRTSPIEPATIQYFRIF